MNPVNPGFSPYGYQPYNPMLSPQQRIAELEQQYPQYANQNQMNQNQQPGMMNQNFIKCRAVTSEDEARAAMIDLNGSIHVFTDIGNKKIYTKQINIDGTATLNTYVLDSPQEAEKQPHTVQNAEMDLSDYVQQKDLENVCQAFNNQICDLEDRLRGYDKALQSLAEKQAKGGTKK